MGEKRGVRGEKRRRKRGRDEREGQRAKMRQAERVGSRGQPGTAGGHPGRAVERVDWRVWMSGGSQSAGLITCWLQRASDNHNGLCRALRSLYIDKSETTHLCRALRSLGTSELDGRAPYVLLYSRASHNKPQRRKALGKINESEKKKCGRSDVQSRECAKEINV